MSIDQRAEPQAAVSTSFTPTQAAVLDIWRKILWVSDIGVNDNFIDLGGHSPAATRRINPIRQMFQVEVPVDAFFIDSADVVTIAALIDQARANEGRP